MKETVVVTAWNRPDFFRAALTCLARADDGSAEYLLALDRGHTREVKAVATWFSSAMGRTVIHCPTHPYKGNSYNTLHALKTAAATRAERVYLVEDDILVGSDFFTFHRAAHALVPGALAVSACRNQFFAEKDDPAPDEERVYRHASYQSLGVSFDPAVLKLLDTHMNRRYFSDPIAYCRTAFPSSKIHPANAEQDGLIHRIGEAEGLETVYPCAPRAYHAGFTGYHRRGAALTGSVEERAAQILAMDSDQLNRHARSYRDHVALDLEAERSPVRVLGEQVPA